MKSIKFLTVFFFLTLLLPPPNSIQAQVAPPTVTYDTSSDVVIPGCTEFIVSIEFCTGNIEDVNVFVRPVNFPPFALGEPTVETGSFTNFGLNNILTIGTVPVNQATGCALVEVKYPILGTNPFNLPVFEVGVWNDGSDGCENSTPIDFCPNNPPNCTPCTSVLCDQLCSDFIFPQAGVPVVPAGTVLVSNTNDNTISQIFQNQSPFGFNPGACIDAIRFYHIQEDLLVDTDWCYVTQPGQQSAASAQPTIVFDEGKKIIIPNNVSVVLEGVDIKSCSEIFWDAIEVMPGGSLTMINCDIKDGHNAVRAHEGSTVNIRNCNFTDNYIGIQLDGIDESSDINTPINADIFNNSFEGTGNFVDPYPGQSPLPRELPYAGIRLTDVSFVDLAAPDPFELPTANVFDNMHNGIVSNSSTFILKEVQILNMHFDRRIKPSGNGIFVNNLANRFRFMRLLDSRVENTFVNMKKGIFIQNHFAIVEDARMNNVEIGVEVRDCVNRSIDIENCTIDATEFGIRTINNTPLIRGNVLNNTINIDASLFNPTSLILSGGIVNTENFTRGNSWNIIDNTVNLSRGDVGIHLTNGGGAKIAENQVFKTASKRNQDFTLAQIINSPGTEVDCNLLANLDLDGTFSESKGLEIIDSPEMTISCNDIATVEDGVSFIGPNQGAIFRANRMSGGFVGLVLDAFAVISRQPHRGNCFSNNENAEAVHQSNIPEFVQESLFSVNCGNEGLDDDCICPPLSEIFTGTGNSNDFFDQVNIGDSDQCENENITCANFRGRSMDNITNDNIYLNLSLGRSIYQESQPNLDRMMQQELFNTLSTVNESVLGTSYQEFLDLGRQGDMLHIKSALKNIVHEDEATESISELEEKLDQLNRLEQAYYQEELNLSVYELKKARILEQIGHLSNNMQIAESLIQEEQGSLREEQAAHISNMQGLSIYDANMKWILTKMLEHKQDRFIDFDDTTWSAIYDLAIQCSADAGHAVYIARSLYITKEWIDFYELQSCEEVQERSQNSNKKIGDTMSIFPNPSKGNFSVYWDMETDTQISILDAQGKIMHVQNISMGQNEMDLSKLSSGIYFYQIQSGKADSNSGKLIILE